MRNYSKKATESLFSKEELISAYKSMLLIRRFEEKSGQLYGMGLIGGFCHLYIGQEAVVVGINSALKKGDQVTTTYRDHGHILFAGTDPKYVMAELMGKETGVSRGKGGSMHLFDLENQFYGGHGIVGASVPIGAGVGFANKYRGNDHVSVTYFGDGAANQGQVYETFNMAKLWNLPVIFVLENNEYAMGTSVARSAANDDLYKRGESFGIKGIRANGMDLFEMRETANEVVGYVRSGKGPMLIEAKTYRYRGHSMSDPAKYRTKEEVDEYKKNKDPIENIKKIILKHGYESEKDLKNFDKEIRAIIEEAVEFAKNSNDPSENELYTDIFTDN